MFVQLICKDRNENEMNSLYQLLGALCEREGIQIEDKGDRVEILACPQGKILVTEDDKDLILSASTRHGGPGFHAFVVELFKDIEEEEPGEYELVDDMDYSMDGDFDALKDKYKSELDGVRELILNRPGFRDKNYLFDETYYLPMNHEGKVLASAGELDEAQFRNMDLDDLMDSFYVWNDWDRDARFYRNAALSLLAKESFGPYSRMNEKTEKIADEILDDLEIAHREDPDLPLPVAEYEQLASIMHRENKLKDAPGFTREAVQYRTREVYHMFEDAKVAAPGTAERSYDPASQSLFLMAPYTNDQEWRWLIQASMQPSILPNVQDVESIDPVHLEDGKTVQIDAFNEDGIPTVDAIVRQADKTLYLHCIAKEDSEIPFLEECIRKSGFVH